MLPTSERDLPPLTRWLRRRSVPARLALTIGPVLGLILVGGWLAG